MAIRMQQRRATAEQWTLSNPVLGPGEIGFETDTNKFKIGDGINNWGSLTYFIDETNLTGSLSEYVPLTDIGVPNGVASLDANGQVPATQLENATVDLTGYATETYVDTTVNSDISTHNSTTLNVHGIANTAELETQTGAQAKADLAQTTAETNANLYTDAEIATALTTAQGYADVAETDAKLYADSLAVNYDAAGTATAAVDAHNLDTTNVHGIADTSALALTADVNTALDLKANLASPSFTGTVNAEAVTISGDLTVSGTTTTVNAQDLVVTDPLIYVGEGNAANLVDLGFVASFDNGTYQHTGLVRDSSADTWKLFKGVTDEPTTTINFTQGSLDNLEVGTVNATAANIGDVSNTEIQYLNGVTSAVQGQIDAKAPIDSPTFTGTVSGVTAAMVGLGNVDNTSDLNKPISTATQNALDLKANTASPSFTGTVSLPQDTSIGDVSATELGYLNGVTSSIQTQINGKADSSHTHGIADVTDFQISSPVVNQQLVYNGTKWTNTTVQSGSALHPFFTL